MALCIDDFSKEKFFLVYGIVKYSTLDITKEMYEELEGILGANKAMHRSLSVTYPDLYNSLLCYDYTESGRHVINIRVSLRGLWAMFLYKKRAGL